MHQTVLTLIDAFASASLDGRLWQPCLAALAEATGSARAQLIGIGGRHTENFNFITASDESEHKRFAEVASYDPTINFRVAAAAKAAPMTIIAEAQYDTEILGLSNCSYLEFCHETDMSFGCQTTLLREADDLIGLSMIRSRRDGRTTDLQKSIFTIVAPHVRSAVRVQQALGDDSTNLSLEAFGLMNIAAFACDSDRVVRGYSIAAEDTLSGGLLRVIGGRLAARDVADDKILQKAVHSSFSHAGARLQSVVLPNGGEPIILDVVLLPSRPWNLAYVPRVLVIVRHRDQKTARSVALLRAAYELTDAEAQVALAYAHGLTRDAIAGIRQVSRHTVHDQTKSLFSKMGVSRQSALVSLASKFL